MVKGKNCLFRTTCSTPTLCQMEKCVRLLRSWCGSKHFSKSKTVFINMNI